MREQPCRHQTECRRRVRRCSKCQRRDLPAAHDEDHGEEGCPPSCWSSWTTVWPGRDPMLEQEKSVRSPALVEEGVGETACDELTTAPIHPRATEEVEEFGVKDVSRRLFSDVILFIIILRCLIGNKVN